MTQTAQKHAFQAEVQDVLKLVINSLYSNADIFLRELVSNAADACDKLRFELLQNPQLIAAPASYKVTVKLDPKSNTVTISDNGIGMSQAEAVTNLGTIAKSGTRDFIKALNDDQKKDANLIGQFGVGFYSAFIVSDKVVVRSLRAGLPADQAVEWTSQGVGDFEVATIQKEAHGTDIELHLKEQHKQYLESYKIHDIIQRYSDHIAIPVELISPDDKGELKTETITQSAALWLKPKSKLTEGEYFEFYKSVAHDWQNPLAYTHSKLEGTLEYTMLLYIPSHAPFDLYSTDKARGVRLYVKRVFIMDDAEKLLPRYLRFVRGVIDSNDLPLNVSRELLQDHQILQSIRSTAVKKILDVIEDLAKNKPTEFATFIKVFGPVLKEGVVEDHANKDRIASLCRFHSTASDKADPEVSLDDYVFRAKSGQNEIFYLTAETASAARNSPLLEAFKSKDLEVLLLTDRIDHWFVTHVNEYKGKKLVSISKSDVDLDKFDSEIVKPKTDDKTEATHKAVAERIQKVLAERVSEVRVSKRLTSSPACVVSAKDDLDPSLKRLFAQMGQAAPDVKPVLEINPQHSILARLAVLTDESVFANWAHVLLDQAILADGGQLPNAAEYVARVNQILVQ